MGRKIQVKFTVTDEDQWFDGIIMSYDGASGKYGIYFPYDKETIYMLLNEIYIAPQLL